MSDKKDQSCKKNPSTEAEHKTCSEEKAMKHNANSSSPEEVKEQGMNKKKSGKVFDKPSDYVVDPDDNKLADAGSDKFGTRGI